jgi:hypothetical protein
MRILLISLSLSLFLACGEKIQKHYKLSDDQLVSLMLDLQMAEVLLPSMGPVQQDTLKNLLWGQFSSIYDMTPEEIEAEVKLLQNDPDKLKMIMDRVKMRSDSLQVQ